MIYIFQGAPVKESKAPSNLQIGDRVILPTCTKAGNITQMIAAKRWPFRAHCKFSTEIQRRMPGICRS